MKHSAINICISLNTAPISFWYKKTSTCGDNIQIFNRANSTSNHCILLEESNILYTIYIDLCLVCIIFKGKMANLQLCMNIIYIYMRSFNPLTTQSTAIDNARFSRLFSKSGTTHTRHTSVPKATNKYCLKLNSSHICAT